MSLQTSSLYIILLFGMCMECVGCARVDCNDLYCIVYLTDINRCKWLWIDMNSYEWLLDGYHWLWTAMDGYVTDMNGYETDMTGYEWLYNEYWWLWDRDGRLLDGYQWIWTAMNGCEPDMNSHETDMTSYEWLSSGYCWLWDRNQLISLDMNSYETDMDEYLDIVKLYLFIAIHICLTVVHTCKHLFHRHQICSRSSHSWP